MTDSSIAPAPVLLLHSSGLSGTQWTRLAATLRKDYAVQAPDLLGYGAHPAPYSTPFQLKEEVDRLLAMLDRPTIVIGHSYGGFLGLQMALAAPALVKALIVFDPIAFGALYSSNGSGPEQLSGPRFTQADSSREEWVESFVDFWGETGSWSKISPRAQQSMLASYPKIRLEVEALSQDRTPHTAYQAIACPTLLMGGQASPQVEKDVVLTLEKAIPRAKLCWIDGGHMAPLSNSVEFEAAVGEFLSSLC